CTLATAKAGTPARDTENGRGGGGDNAGGTGGQGGFGGKNRDGGAGGGYLSSGQLTNTNNATAMDFSKQGGAGGLTGGAGGSGGAVNGGFGYGGGGGGIGILLNGERRGSGGGGGFSGGGGGNVGNEGNNGGGAGSFVNEAARSVVWDAGGTTNSPSDGSISYNFTGVFLDGTLIPFDFVGTYQDITIPITIDTLQNKFVSFTMKGADGGARNEGPGNRRGGGGGANISASFDIGFAAGKLNPGGTLRFIVGESGNSSNSSSFAGGGGGGGTGILYLPPGVAEDDDCPSVETPTLNIGQSCWTILAVAGGGGGATADGVNGRQGIRANDGPEGLPGAFVNNNIGSGGRAQYSTDESKYNNGGGGGYRGDGSLDSYRGRRGGFTGGAGGSGDGKKIGGGFGYGGGGSGYNNGSTTEEGAGAGGGGGYTGGSGNTDGAGGGAGSYVNPDHRDASITRSSSDLSPDNGFIIMQFPPCPPGAPEARCISAFEVEIEGSEDFTLIPDSVNNGSFDVNDPPLPLTYQICRPFDGGLACTDDWGFECDNEFGDPPTTYVLKVSNGVAEATCSFVVTIVQGELDTIVCPAPVTVAAEDCQDFVFLEPQQLPACENTLSTTIFTQDGRLDNDNINFFDSQDGRLLKRFELGTNTVTYFATAL
ncbi:MAG: hypothetical protein AAF840_13585, partial [Bacteroidota bacterium]